MTMDTIAPSALRKITRELYALDNDPPEGIRLILNEDSITDIQAWIQGPDGTPYEGGCFRLRIQLSADFPNSPPKCFFMTKIFHPNVSKQGDVCVSTLKKDWKKDLGLRHILLVVKCLLIVPNPESALNEEAGRQLLERYNDYARHARLMTDIHAKGQDIFSSQSSESTKTDVCTDTDSSATQSYLQPEQPSSSSSKTGTLRSLASESIEATTSEHHVKLAGAFTGEQQHLSPPSSSSSTSSSPSLNGHDQEDSHARDSLFTAKTSALQESAGMATTTLKRKLAQEARAIEPSSQPKQPLCGHAARQTLQGLPTHQNQTPLWTQHSLKQPPGNPKHEILRDKIQDASLRTALGTKAALNSKELIENRKRTLRRL